MKIDHIVFYGTLMSMGMTKMHEKIKSDLVYEGNCILYGKLYTLGRYPGLKSGNYLIHGELYKILNTDLLNILDEYEAVDNENPLTAGFTRKSVVLVEPKKKAWVYYYEGDVSEKNLLKTNFWK